MSLRKILLLAAIAVHGAWASAAPACPTPGEVSHQHLYGVWRVEFEQGATASLRFEKHAAFAQSVSGEIQRGTARAQVAGDVDEGVFHLEESVDGTTIAATWTGQVVENSCGKEIKGTWNNQVDGTRRAFVLRKPPGWQ
ncbi:MAG TPA: hypothetical protein VLJ57_10495 [Burkholderiaceae bacterium]|nr:hypothetical protein [Burkholderiaceae bacterium]